VLQFLPVGHVGLVTHILELTSSEYPDAHPVGAPSHVPAEYTVVALDPDPVVKDAFPITE